MVTNHPQFVIKNNTYKKIVCINDRLEIGDANLVISSYYVEKLQQFLRDVQQISTYFNLTGRPVNLIVPDKFLVNDQIPTEQIIN